MPKGLYDGWKDFFTKKAFYALGFTVTGFKNFLGPIAPPSQCHKILIFLTGAKVVHYRHSFTFITLSSLKWYNHSPIKFKNHRCKEWAFCSVYRTQQTIPPKNIYNSSDDNYRSFAKQLHKDSEQKGHKTTRFPVLYVFLGKIHQDKCPAVH